jgi:clan AA aspartic protease
MIRGLVTADHEAIIRFLVRGPSGQRQHVEALVDTGFNGWLTLPPGIINSLGLPWRRRGRALLADGSDSIFDNFEGTVVWDRRHRIIAVDEVDTVPLVGMALMRGYELNVQIRSRGKMIIKPLP